MNILIKPIVTEKMTSQGDKMNRYGSLSTGVQINYR